MFRRQASGLLSQEGDRVGQDLVAGIELNAIAWAKARAKNPEVIMRVHVQDETDESEFSPFVSRSAANQNMIAE